MRSLILAVCLAASVCAYHYRSNVVLKETKIVNHPGAKYKLDKLVPIEELVSHNRVIPEPRDAAVLNEFGDQIFANAQTALVENGLDPMTLPDLTESFEYHLIITYTGELVLTNGWLSDISSIHRGGDIIVDYDSPTQQLSFILEIAFDDLAFVYDYSASIMGLGPSGTVDGKVVDVQIAATVGFDSAELVVTLDSFEVVHAGTIDVAFHGSSLVDWLLDILSDIVTTVLHDLILDLVAGVVRDSLNGIVDSLNQAIYDVLNPTTTAAPGITQAPYFFK